MIFLSSDLVTDSSVLFSSSFCRCLFQKPSLDQNDVKSYRPVANLSFISKIIEKIVIVLSQISGYLNQNDEFCSTQFAYHSKHNTKMPLLKIMNDFCYLHLTERGLHPKTFGLTSCTWYKWYSTASAGVELQCSTVMKNVSECDDQWLAECWYVAKIFQTCKCDKC